MQRDRFVIGGPLGRWQTNCYVVGDRAAGSCVVIDPGEGGVEAVPQMLARAGVPCEAILLTHGHIDHFWSAPALARTLDVPVLLHSADRYLWQQPQQGFRLDLTRAMLQEQFGLDWTATDEQVQWLNGDSSMMFAGMRFDAKHNPGHTPGHMTFLAHGMQGSAVEVDLGDPADADLALFSGDLVFAGSIGRTDFPNGSTEAIMRSLADTVLPLDDDVLILSGHGPDTTVGRERRSNPFLQQIINARH